MSLFIPSLGYWIKTLLSPGLEDLCKAVSRKEQGTARLGVYKTVSVRRNPMLRYRVSERQQHPSRNTENVQG